MKVEAFKELTIYEAENIQSYFLNFIEKKERISLDMHAVEKIDMVGIQLLISLVKSQNNQNLDIEFINIKDNIMNEIITSHCENALGITNG